MAKRLRGVIAAIATPIDLSGEPDTDRFLRLARYLLANGCDGLNVLGTTGESTSFSAEQRMRLMSSIASAGLPLDRLMVGTGAAAVADAVRITEHAAELGFAGALVLPPFYYKGVPSDGVIRYIERIVTATARRELPIYLYNFPALSGVPYDVVLVARLIEAFGERMAGLKDSSGDVPYERTLAEAHPKFDVFPANETMLGEARKGTFAGCISATANLNSSLCALGLRGDDAALATAVKIRKLFDGRPLVPGIKALLAHIHQDASLARVMPPMIEASVDEAKEIIAGYEKLLPHA